MKLWLNCFFAANIYAYAITTYMVESAWQKMSPHVRG